MPHNAITIAGNLGADPELRYTPAGNAVVRFSIGVTDRKRDAAGQWQDGDTAWFSVIAWNDLAENIAATFQRGNRVIVTGTMHQRSYQTDAGETRYVWEVRADEVGASLRFATAVIKRIARNRPAAPEDDPWAGVEASPAEPAVSEAGSVAEPSGEPGEGNGRSRTRNRQSPAQARGK